MAIIPDKLMKLYNFKIDEIESPTVDDLTTAFAQLGRKEQLHAFHFMRDRQTLTIVHVIGGRVHFTFADRTSSLKGGTLLDETYTKDDGEVLKEYDAMEEWIFLFRTVPKETAKDVALYYFTHRDFPSGCKWEGNM